MMLLKNAKNVDSLIENVSKCEVMSFSNPWMAAKSST